MRIQETNLREFSGARSIVVGVNGSRASLAALRWAVAEAEARKVPLVTVHAWEPSVRRRAPYATVAERRTPAEDRESGQRLVQVAVAAVRMAHPGADVRAVLAEGPPVAVLLRYSDDALLLTLGQSLYRDGSPTELGPVTRACVRESHCPVVTVPELRTTARHSELPPVAPVATALAG
ncbi:universal stress protein [Streptomyces sp. NPDC087422]|uniref:universal stress protein n=1 Tax=Streptomyces sp. NPDC087422 TaxID=3365786 RepID=UPI0037FBBDD5